MTCIGTNDRAARMFARLAVICLFTTASAALAEEPAEEPRLVGGEEGTALESMTIEAENQIAIHFERPPLFVDLDPLAAPGLEGGPAIEVLNRSVPDLYQPFIESSRGFDSPYLGRPWFAQFETDGVARFRPDMEKVARWNLLVVSSTGDEVLSHSGEGKPPKEIVWDGRTSTGEPAMNGLTYSYVLEAFDKAGNKRRFAGEGFQVRPFILQDDDALTMQFSSAELGAWSSGRRDRGALTPALLLETASRINQLKNTHGAVRVTVTARTFDQADQLSQSVASTLGDSLLGGPARVLALTDVRSDAPEAAAVRVVAER